MRLSVLRQSLIQFKPRFQSSHIKNLYTEGLKYEIEMEHQRPLIEETTRVYKPTYPIEFNREGEVLLYSCEPVKEVVWFMQMTVYFKYPYILYESAIPIFLYAYLMNPLDLEWYWNNVSLAFAWSGIVLFNNPLAI